ncbi:MAG TPA: DMT family transporter [Solirubrobacteraceae bacterium]|jgi:drug/metabolite transporter (DMT)-like permease
MTVLFALAASVFIGISDFLGGTASRVGSPLAVTVVLQLAALATLTPIAVVLGASGLTVHDAGLGAVSGLATSAAYVAFFTAIARGRISIVVPVSAAVTALLPAVVGIAEGDPLSALATGGILCALVAIPLVAYEPGETDQAEQWSNVRQVLVSVMCGVGFGVYFVCVGHTHRSAGLWPTVGNLAVAAAMIAPLAIRRGAMKELASARRPAIAGGIALGGADTFLTSALQRGPLTVASVLGNLYPLVTIGLGVSLLGERVRSWQAAGIVLAIAGVTMIAAG